jgi:tripartite-type tricarboxylate transporter receptor subunit TctC
MTGIRSRIYRAAATAIAGLVLASGSFAEGYPDHTVTLVVGYAPGGAIDLSARLLAQALAARWGQTVVVDNRTGANGTIAAAAVGAARPDGYTLLVTATSHTLSKFVVKGLRYDVLASFEPVALTVEVPNVLVVNANSPYQNVQQLVDAMHAKTKAFSYASQGVGGIPHLAGELFKIRTDTEMVHVPYRGANQGMTDLIAGVVDMSFPSPASITAGLSAGRLRALAVASDQRFPLLKDVPTFAEAGVPGFTIGTWHGVMAPAHAPTAIVSKLNADINAIIETSAFKTALLAQGNVAASPVTPEQFATRLAGELHSFEAVARRVDLTAN